MIAQAGNPAPLTVESSRSTPPQEINRELRQDAAGLHEELRGRYKILLLYVISLCHETPAALDVALRRGASTCPGKKAHAPHLDHSVGGATGSRLYVK